MKDNLILILHLAADGKLDRLDMQILRIQSERGPVGALLLAKTLHTPRATIQFRLKKIKGLMLATT
jgi:DNA-binding Lrp family transcriptional regulator